MICWKQYAAVLIALGVLVLTGCGHSQDSAAPTTPAPQPSASDMAARAQAAQQAGAQQAAGRAAAAQAQQNAPK